MNKYEQIAFELRDEIRHQIYPAGEKMPSEEKLAKRFSTSRVTMSRSLFRQAVKIILHCLFFHCGKKRKTAMFP